MGTVPGLLTHPLTGNGAIERLPATGIVRVFMPSANAIHRPGIGDGERRDMNFGREAKPSLPPT